jgi:hypothetical protein
VRVHDLHGLALFRALLDQRRHRPGKRGEARRVVHVRNAAFTVDTAAVEQAGQVEQDELRTGRQLAIEYVHFAAVSQREWRQATRREQASGLEARRARGGHRDAVPELTEGLHEGRCRITSFGFPHVRGQFGKGKQDIHCSGVYHGQF